jgi:8-oxo-dGTP pyrophosphatase MutT (NUDIX family)
MGAAAMAGRIDYYDDPDAPAPNSMVPSVNLVTVDGDGRILLIRRSDNGSWALPGGAIELGESALGAAVRETLEETGITCEVTGLVGLYTDPRHLIHYTSNDEVRQEFCIVFAGRPIAGEPTPSSESIEVHWVDPAEVGELTMHRSMSLRITDYLEWDGTPRIGAP